MGSNRSSNTSVRKLAKFPAFKTLSRLVNVASINVDRGTHTATLYFIPWAGQNVTAEQLATAGSFYVSEEIANHKPTPQGSRINFSSEAGSSYSKQFTLPSITDGVPQGYYNYPYGKRLEITSRYDNVQTCTSYASSHREWRAVSDDSHLQ